VEEEVLRTLRTQLQRAGVTHRAAESCPGARGFVLLGVSARYLDPETYRGFPANSYTYVTTGQVGAHVEGATTGTSLQGSVYGASESDLFAAPSDEALRRELVALGHDQVRALTRAWLAANVVPTAHYLMFAGVALALIVARAVVTVALAP